MRARFWTIECSELHWLALATLALRRDSQLMKNRGWGWVLPALVLLSGAWGCVDSNYALNAQPQPPGHHGGQTGSLRPCSAPAFAPTSSIPTGDAALVFHTGCATDAEFKITNENGEPVPFELEALDDGVVLLATEEALTPGSYQVETPDGNQQTVTVTAAATLPEELGTLTYSSGSCDPLFELVFDDAVAPYLRFLRLEYAVDGGARQVWFEYGTLASQDSAWLELADPTSGEHRLEVFGTIAGEDVHPDSATLTFDFTPCAAADDDGMTVCALGAGGAGTSRAGGVAALVLVGAALALGRRRQSVTRRR